MKKLKQKQQLLIIGIVLGIVYGLFTRLVFGQKATLASVTFLFIIPAILGIIPLMFADNEKLKSYRKIIFIPWLTVASFFLTMFLFGLEDILCLFILATPFFILGTIGALIYRIFQINKRKRKGKLFTLLLLPFLLAPIEEYIKRLKKLEDLAYEFKGIEKAYAMQAGREIRVMVLPDQIDDNEMTHLARDLTNRIEKELNYPGKVKITLIREKRIVKYAV